MSPPASDSSTLRGRQRQPERSAPIELSQGALVAERYTLERRLGVGGMGSVWAARHRELGHLVAIKLLSVELPDAPEARERFELEGQLAARLGQTSRHIAQVLDHGVLAVRSGGEVIERPYLVMEYLDGVSLADLLRQRGRLPLAEVAPIVRQIGRALAVTHAAGVVHRDLKPGNVFLLRDEEDGPWVKLIDFGVAKASANDLTLTGTLVGTPAYMSPEQIRGDKQIDGRADLWGLAAIAFCLAVGEPPFGKGSVAEIAGRVLWQAAPRASAHVPALPAAFDRWLQRGLAREPSSRFQSAQELADALEEVVRREGAGTAGDVAPVIDAVAEAPATETGAEAIPAAPKRIGAKTPSTARRRWLAGLAVTTAGAAWAVWRRSRPSTTPPPVPPVSAPRLTRPPTPAPQAPVPVEVRAVTAAAPPVAKPPPRKRRVRPRRRKPAAGRSSWSDPNAL